MGASTKTEVQAAQFQGGRDVCLLAGRRNTLLLKKKKIKKSQNKTTNKTNLTPECFRHPPIEADYAKLIFSKDTTRLGWTNPTGTGRTAEKAFKMRKTMFKASIPTGGEIPRLCACRDAFSFHSVAL